MPSRILFGLIDEPRKLGDPENGVLAEHWDVLQDEATQADSKSGLPMFGSHFPA